MSERLGDIVKSIDLKTALYFVVAMCSLGAYYIVMRFGIVAGVLFGLSPLLLYLFFSSLVSPYGSYIFVFVANYFLMGLTRYVPAIKGGITLDLLLAYTLTTLIIRIAFFGDINLRKGINMATGLALIWFIFCAFQLLNTYSDPLAWLTSVRGLALDFLIIAFLTSVLLTKFIDLKRILFILSLLTLVAAGKAFMQRYIGFDSYEWRWLYELGGMKTHLIYTGTRYFSIYTDAGTFGASMGMAMVIYTIASIYTKNRMLTIYYLGVAAVAAYAMVLSGTRGALAVPFAGFSLYVILSRKPLIAIGGSALIILTFAFFSYTTIGEGHASIRRMRSAFNKNDASLTTRLDNQKKLLDIMKDYPFGTGIGMGGVKAQKIAPDAVLSQIPTDSWYVMIWVETGTWGIILHLLILGSFIFYGGYLALFKLRDPQLRGFIAAITSGLFGIIAASYGNEIIGQLPVGMIVYMMFTFIVISPSLDAELSKEKDFAQTT